MIVETTNIPAVGIHFDIPFAKYQSWVALNSSSLDTRSGEHTNAKMRRELRRESKVFNFGRMAHTAILEPNKFPIEYGVMQETNGRTKAAKEEKAAMLAIGKQPATQLDWDIACKMRDSVTCHLGASLFLSNCKREVSIVWTDPGTGVLCKARLDGIDTNANRVVDLKTTLDASPATFARSVATYNYHRQAWWYCRGWSILTDQFPEFVWVAVEKLSPFGVALYAPMTHMFELGESEATDAIRAYRDRDESEPCYGNNIQPISLPAWRLRQLEDTYQAGPDDTGYGLTIAGERV